jgi:GNAT superfamily N-acetyltransferase
MRLKEAAGWNQTESDWLRLLAVEPEGCFGLDRDGALAASATAVCYGGELAWIGMVLTIPEFRGRGLARTLVQHALDFLERRSVRRAGLDATDMGAPLYAKLGFQPECAVERWGLRAASGASGTGRRPVHEGLEAVDLALDREAFGADRTRLLEIIADETYSRPGEGYALGRPGSQAAYFGPCVARSEAAARALLESFLAAHAGEAIVWDLLPANTAAVELARDHGFTPVRRLTRMARPLSGAGLRPAPNDLGQSMVFAIAGFEFG